MKKLIEEIKQTVEKEYGRAGAQSKCGGLHWEEVLD